MDREIILPNFFLSKHIFIWLFELQFNSVHKWNEIHFHHTNQQIFDVEVKRNEMAHGIMVLYNVQIHLKILLSWSSSVFVEIVLHFIAVWNHNPFQWRNVIAMCGITNSSDLTQLIFLGKCDRHIFFSNMYQKSRLQKSWCSFLFSIKSNFCVFKCNVHVSFSISLVLFVCWYFVSWSINGISLCIPISTIICMCWVLF